MKMFIDTHDKSRGTFPEGLSRVDFAAFYEKYEAACKREGVVNLRVHVGFGEGRAFCVNLAPNVDAVRNAHEAVGLPFDSITEVTEATPFTIFAAGKAA